MENEYLARRNPSKDEFAASIHWAPATFPPHFASVASRCSCNGSADRCEHHQSARGVRISPALESATLATCPRQVTNTNSRRWHASRRSSGPECPERQRRSSRLSCYRALLVAPP